MNISSHRNRNTTVRASACLAAAGWLAFGLILQTEGASPKRWTLGTPIVTYWAGPAMTDATAAQMAEGGFNVVWCTEKDLDTARKHGLRAQLQDALINPGSLEDSTQLRKLENLVQRVRTHPALYSYFITDEPNATNFVALGKLVAFLRQRDPAHLAYINLFPTYANNAQLGNEGDKVTAYKAHLGQYVSTVKPDLISYDHYQFTTKGDTADYFLNLALIRDQALQTRVPFLNIVQACTWTPSMRVPGPDEMRYLVNTSLAYGAMGISYYVYCCQGHTGGIANADGTPTPLYGALKNLNREFVAIASQLRPLQSLGVYHAGMQPPGAVQLPASTPLKILSPVETAPFSPPEPVKGVLIGFFGNSSNPEPASTTHAVVVNLDYAKSTTLSLQGKRRLRVFDPATGKWTRASASPLQLNLPPGGGQLLRVK